MTSLASADHSRLLHALALAEEQLDDLREQTAADRNRIVHLEIALTSSRCIGAAVGILMALMKLTEADAFEVLKTASQNNNRKLRDVADDVVATGLVPNQTNGPAATHEG